MTVTSWQSVQATSIRSYRQSAGLTQEQMAQALGITRMHLCSIERGRRNMSPHLAQKIFAIFGISMDDGNGGGTIETDGLQPDDYEALLAQSWALYYAGEARIAIPGVLACIKALAPKPGLRWKMTLGRFYQLAGVLARDTNNAQAALQYGATSVDLARRCERANDLASALFRYARTVEQYQDAIYAVQLIREAHALAPSCSNPLKTWLHLARVEMETRTHASTLFEILPFLDRATAELSNRPGQDDSFTKVNMPGIQHIDLLARIYSQESVEDVLRTFDGYIRNLPAEEHRWRTGMLATEAMAYAYSLQPDYAASLAEDVLPVARKSHSHMRYLREGLAVLVENEKTKNHPDTLRMKGLLGVTV